MQEKMDPHYLEQLKKRIVSCSKEELEASLDRLQFRLKLELAELRNAQPEDIVPSVGFRDIEHNGGRIPEHVAKKV